MNNYRYNAQDSITLLERLQAPIPRFFKKLRTIGLTLTAVGTALLSLDISLPPILTEIAGYLVAAGTVAAALCQTTVDYKALQIQKRGL